MKVSSINPMVSSMMKERMNKLLIERWVKALKEVLEARNVTNNKYGYSEDYVEESFKMKNSNIPGQVHLIFTIKINEEKNKDEKETTPKST